MAPSASANTILNYILLLFGMALISVLLQSLVRFEALHVQTVWAVSTHLSDHHEDHVALVADEIWGANRGKSETLSAGEGANAKPGEAVDAAVFKRKMSKRTSGGGLGLSNRQSRALLQHLDLKRTGSVSRQAFEKFYHTSKEGKMDVDDIMRRQSLRRGTLCAT